MTPIPPDRLWETLPDSSRHLLLGMLGQMLVRRLCSPITEETDAEQ